MLSGSRTLAQGRVALLQQASFIANATVWDGKNVFEGCNVQISGGSVRVGVDDAIVEEAVANKALVVDGQRSLVIPGLVNAHTHIYSTLVRGMPFKLSPPNNFVQTLERLWWRLDRGLNTEAVRASAMVTITESIKSGVTTIFDHHSSPSCVTGSLGSIADVALKAGIRACLAYEVSDRNGEENMLESIDENKKFAERCQALRDSNDSDANRLAASFGLHASFTLSDTTLDKCVEANQGSGNGFHIHVAEDRADVDSCLQKHRVGLLQRLEQFGIIDRNHDSRPTLVGHGVHLSNDEIARLSDMNAIVVHNASSNMNNGVGAAPLQTMIEKGLSLAVGTDGMRCCVREEAQIASLLASHIHARAGLSLNGREVKYAYGLTEGIDEWDGDVVVMPYDAPTAINGENITAHILNADKPLHVWCAGVPLMIDGDLLPHTGLSDGAGAAAAKKSYQTLWSSSVWDEPL